MIYSNTCPAPLDWEWLSGHWNGDTLPPRRQIPCVSLFNHTSEAFLTRLGIYPFPDADPFILHKRPDIYFLGNQPEFETALVGGQ